MSIVQDQTHEAVELVTVDAVTAGIAVDRRPGNRACLHPDRPIGRKLAEGFPFEQEMWERIGAGGDAGQRVQRNACGLGDDLIEGVALVQLPDQRVDQFFPSVVSAAFLRWATTEPA
jgi:hypothetical protein